jgi:hypothetical protein
MKKRILIVMSGGVLQHVVTNVDDVELVVKDWDEIDAGVEFVPDHAFAMRHITDEEFETILNEGLDEYIKLTQPSNAPNTCFTVERRDGKSVFFQTDTDYPGLARTFGWVGDDSDVTTSYEYLCEHVGMTAKDPGYFGDST